MSRTAEEDKAPLLGGAEAGGNIQEEHQALLAPGAGSGGRPFFLFDPNRFWFRYTVLFFVCFLTFGSYFCYDNPGALQSPVEEAFHIGKFKYELLYSLYSWPNTVQVFFGGWLIDRFLGLRFGAFLFCGLVMLGQIIFAVGTTIAGSTGYYIALIGRFVFGLGGESLSVAQNTYSAKWFRGNELAMAFGIALSFSRIGSAVNFNVEPTIASKFNLATAIWVGAVICVISLVCAVSLAILDKRGEKNAEAKEVKAGDKVSLLDVLYFPWSIWFIYGICVSFYISVFIFITIAQDYIREKWDYSKSEAGHIVSIPYFFSAGASPLLGFAVDKIGRSLTWVCLSTVTMVGVHLLLALTHLTPIVGLVIMGASYSVLAAALWPCVAFIVDLRRLGTAYGLMTALQNLGLAVAPLVIGKLTSAEGYRPAIYVFAGCAGVSAILAFLLIFVDLKEGGMLNASATVRKAKLEALRKAAEIEDAEKGEYPAKPAEDSSHPDLPKPDRSAMPS